MHVTMTSPGYRSTETFVYDAPERYEEIFYENDTPLRRGPYTGQEILIGTTGYGRANSSEKWSIGPPQNQPSDSASWQASIWFPDIVDGTSVKRSGNVYYSFTAPYVVDRAFGPSTTTYRKVATTVIQDGRVVSEDILTTVVDPKHADAQVAVVAQVVVTYSAFGTSPQVTAPPASDIAG